MDLALADFLFEGQLLLLGANLVAVVFLLDLLDYLGGALALLVAVRERESDLVRDVAALFLRVRSADFIDISIDFFVQPHRVDVVLGAGRALGR